MKKEKEREPLLIKLSASSVKSYEQCPRKYFFNYIERAPKKEWEHFDLGNLTHTALECFHKAYMNKGDKRLVMKNVMSESFAKARKKYPNIKGNLLTEAKDMLTDYLKAINQNGMPNVKGVETNFSFNINKDVLVRGFLDRLDEMKDGRFHIIDYKTTKKSQYLEDFQLLVYGLWLLKEYPDVEHFKGSYVLLRHGSVLKSYDFTVEDVERVKKKLIEYAEKIRNEDKWTPIPHRLCNWCDFQSICPAQKAW